MNDSDLIRALRRIKMETGSLVCLGCGHESNCSTYGCAVINEAIKRLEMNQSTTLGGTYVSVEWFNNVEAELKKYKATGLDPEEIKERLEAGENLFFERADLYNDLGPVDHLRKLIQAEKDGRLVVLPCKVGYVLYHIAFGKIIETKVRSFCIGHPSHNVEKLDLRMIRTDRWDILIEELGKTVFLTREEAEAALKKREVQKSDD